jgi:nucleotide-binding universal stress UspA family protein
MKQKILIAFDDSENAMRAVAFVADTFTSESRVTLFHVLQDTAALCEMNSPELTSYFQTQQTTFCALEDQKKILVEEAMQKAKTLLVKAGFDAAQISLKLEAKKNGVARDIVSESKNGYTLVVLGRRGFSGIREFILGSVSQKVLHLAKDLSVLMVN